MPSAPEPHVVIVGGGFGGLHAARTLAGHPVRVTLLDRRNHHLFQPLLYQVATAALNASDIAQPLRSVLRQASNVTVLLAEVRSVELRTRRLALDWGTLTYDALILAVGASHSYFHHHDWEVLAPGLKTLEDALEIRRRVLVAYEAAEREADGAEQRALLTSVIIGGGPTGVELAGALAEISRQTIARDFRRIDPTRARVILLEGGRRILHSFPASLSERAETSLRGLGGRRPGGFAHPHARGAPGSLGPNPCGSGSLHSGTSRELRRRRHGGVPPSGRRDPTRGGSRGHAGRTSRGRQCAQTTRGAANARLPLPRQGEYGDHRARGCRGGAGPSKTHGTGRVAGLALRAHRLSDRLPQPLPRALPVGMGLRHLVSRRAAHYGSLAREGTSDIGDRHGHPELRRATLARRPEELTAFQTPSSRALRRSPADFLLGDSSREDTERPRGKKGAEQ